MCLIFIPRPAPTEARNRGYRRWFRQEPSGVSRGTGSPWKCAECLQHTQRDMRLIFIPRPAPTGARNRGYRRWFRQEPSGVSRGYWIPSGSMSNFFDMLTPPKDDPSGVCFVSWSGDRCKLSLPAKREKHTFSLI